MKPKQHPVPCLLARLATPSSPHCSGKGLAPLSQDPVILYAFAAIHMTSSIWVVTGFLPLKCFWNTFVG